MKNETKLIITGVIFCTNIYIYIYIANYPGATELFSRRYIIAKWKKWFRYIKNFLKIFFLLLSHGLLGKKGNSFRTEEKGLRIPRKRNNNPTL